MDDVDAHAMPMETPSRTGWWIAGVLAALLVAGAPGYWTIVTQVPTRGEFARIQEQQNATNQRLATISERLTTQQLQLTSILSQLARDAERDANRGRGN